MRRNVSAAFLAAATLVSMAVPTAQAATIVWGPALNITGDADVSTLGASVYAYTFGPNTQNSTQAATTVNGVNFAAFPVAFNSPPITIGNVTARETNGPSWGLSFGNSSAAPYANLSAGYRGLLDGFISSGVVESIEVTMRGLTVGQVYQVQAWAHIGTGGSLVVQMDNSTQLDANTTNTEGGLGQYAIGTFVADVTSQIFTQQAVSGNIAGPFGSIPALNGFQLRSVPEPTTIAAALGLAGVTLVRRRRAGKR